MNYKVVGPETTVEKIRKVIETDKQTMFPILSDDYKFLGYILEQDLVNKNPNTTAGQVFADTIMSGKPRGIVVHSDDPLDVAKEILDTTHLPFVPVVKLDSRYVGTIDAIAVAAATFPHR